MAAGFVIDWTTWRVWRHPRMACHALDQLTTDLMTTEEKLRETLDLLEEQRRECVRLTTSLTELSERLITKENELVTARRELDMARADLAEHESVDAKIAAFSKELSKVELMKRKYEKTITMLRGRLTDARKRLGEKDNYDLFETIRMDAPAEPEDGISRNNRISQNDRNNQINQNNRNNPISPTNPISPIKAPEKAPDEEDEEWLDEEVTTRDAEVGKLDAALRRKPQKEPKPGELRVAPGRQADDDWLLSLPENL